MFKFNKCFSQAAKADTKCVELAKFLPPGDEDCFNSVWLLPLDQQFDSFQSLFLEKYYSRYLSTRKVELAKKSTDYSSLLDFFNHKVKVYKKYENSEETNLISRVFYELPSSICSAYINRHHFINKDKLVEFLSFNDYQVRAQYLNIEQRTDSLNLHSSSETPSTSVDTSQDTILQFDFEDTRAFSPEEPAAASAPENDRRRRQKRLRAPSASAMEH